jgi:hypothetical protein
VVPRSQAGDLRKSPPITTTLPLDNEMSPRGPREGGRSHRWLPSFLPDRVPLARVAPIQRPGDEHLPFAWRVIVCKNAVR